MARVDDRLVHGQVIVGCCEPLEADRLLVCDAAVAADPLRQSLFAAAAPPGLEIEFVDPVAAVGRLGDVVGETGHDTILLTRDAVSMATLIEAGAAILRVVVGGAHDRPDTVESPEGWFLTLPEREALRRLVERGIDVCFQPVPGAPSIDASDVLGGRP